MHTFLEGSHNLYEAALVLTAPKSVLANCGIVYGIMAWDIDVQGENT
jgi:hypothetical protein